MPKDPLNLKIKSPKACSIPEVFFLPYCVEIYTRMRYKFDVSDKKNTNDIKAIDNRFKQGCTLLHFCRKAMSISI